MTSLTTKIWLPYIIGGSGTDIFTLQLAKNLRKIGYEVTTTPLNYRWQFFPWGLRLVTSPRKMDIIITNSWNGFALKKPGVKHICVAHHLVLDSSYRPYRSFFQRIYHELMIRFFEKWSFRSADKIVAISKYTERKVSEIYGFSDVDLIYNGVDTNFFSPGAKSSHKNFRILYVGNLSKRKGADLLPRIMEKLGDGYHLSFTSGLRTENPFADVSNISALGRLTRDELLAAYRSSDILLFPSRLEGFGLACAEAMACELPVVASNCASLPEVIEDGVTGVLCPVDSVDAFVAAIKALSTNGQECLAVMGRRARNRIVNYFDEQKMVVNYHQLISSLVHGNHENWVD